MTTVQYIATVVLMIGILGCNQQSKTDGALTKNQVDKKVQSDSVSSNQKTDNSKYYATTDTIKISTESVGVFTYSKKEFNQIVDNHPELFTDYWEDPDKKYYCNGESKEFDSEVGQDDYYVLYAYFLKQKNGIDKYAKHRKKLIDIYTNINSLFQRFQYGGTYFGHQFTRILGYAEYSIYLYSDQIDNFEKTYDITKQKELYIQSLRQLIDDESKIDNKTLGKEKIERNKELNIIVDDLNKLITDNFYLRRTQEFHYRNYEYY